MATRVRLKVGFENLLQTYKSQILCKVNFPCDCDETCRQMETVAKCNYCKNLSKSRIKNEKQALINFSL